MLARGETMPPLRLAIAFSLVALAAPARADEAPPADWKDPCLSADIRPEDDCIRCTAPEFKARDCWARALKDGYLQRCRGWSYALLCRAAQTAPDVEPASVSSPTPVPEKKTSGCQGAEVTTLVSLAIVIARCRRRPRSR
jgi:hypothetical protein